MITLHSIRGEAIALNGELFERLEGETETHIHLVNGKSYIVAETIEEVVELLREDRAVVLAMAHQMAAVETVSTLSELQETPLRLVEPSREMSSPASPHPDSSGQGDSQ